MQLAPIPALTRMFSQMNWQNPGNGWDNGLAPGGVGGRVAANQVVHLCNIRQPDCLPVECGSTGMTLSKAQREAGNGVVPEAPARRIFKQMCLSIEQQHIHSVNV